MLPIVSVLLFSVFINVMHNTAGKKFVAHYKPSIHMGRQGRSKEQAKGREVSWSQSPEADPDSCGNSDLKKSTLRGRQREEEASRAVSPGPQPRALSHIPGFPSLS